MSRWARHKILVLLLGVFVTLGMGLSAVQASTMAFKMPMSSEMGSTGHGNCGGCGASGDDAKAMVCMPACVAPVPALLPQADAKELAPSPVAFPLQEFLLTSRAYPPDPYPPRPNDLI